MPPRSSCCTSSLILVAPPPLLCCFSCCTSSPPLLFLLLYPHSCYCTSSSLIPLIAPPLLFLLLHLLISCSPVAPPPLLPSVATGIQKRLCTTFRESVLSFRTFASLWVFTVSKRGGAPGASDLNRAALMFSAPGFSFSFQTAAW